MSSYITRSIGNIGANLYANGFIELWAYTEDRDGRMVQGSKQYLYYSLADALARFGEQFNIDVDYTQLTDEDYIYDEEESC
jgi:hypothetical protein